MPTKRRRLPHAILGSRITEAAIATYKAGAYHALHRALHLRPWECSPLPLGPKGEVSETGIPCSPLGCQPGPIPAELVGAMGTANWAQAVELQAHLDAAVKEAQS